ncbi:hypothetical protein MSG28_006682 [Choristoneura fumiferana]|uniref:Uncharacterized protein n=1 Tax=Choristoneura fumiferana TaxID=7141 RepID=A0ACC0JKS5_CHOFU|nr:hypothetical protein MSG28_006682 [Choristoneura fumiferana]
MGVPAFFRWLSRKYASVIVECNEQRPVDVDGQLVYADSSLPNPNGVEFDNLYLDMNGIIHPCTHPEDKPPPKDEDEMMVAIFECIDRLFRIVRPRKLLYMAIDGVAPRAKMNQQRSRRFRASKETGEKIEEVARIRSELLAKGAYLPPERPKEAHFDSNCITPGTPFMDRLSKCLHYYIHDRLNNDPGWKGIKVILSDANVPGEGEHKIMDYIRRQRACLWHSAPPALSATLHVLCGADADLIMLGLARTSQLTIIREEFKPNKPRPCDIVGQLAQPDHDPNTQHVLCGADADLIMLGLATHEPNFTIIREEFKPNKPRPCDICGQLGHEMKECTGSTPDAAAARADPAFGAQDSFIFVRLCVLREYLEKELQMPNLPFPYDFERALDDWVFMCFFVGNDFLPHLPSLEIREGAVDRLVNLYKKCVFKTRLRGHPSILKKKTFNTFKKLFTACASAAFWRQNIAGWITDSGDVNLERVQLIMDELGHVEDEIFRRRHANELNFRAREKAKKKPQQRPNFQMLNNTQFAPMAVVGYGTSAKSVENAREEAANMRRAGMRAEAEQEQTSGRGRKRTAMEAGLDEDEDAHDEVRLWEEGFKERYYESKFEVARDNLAFSRQCCANAGGALLRPELPAACPGIDSMHANTKPIDTIHAKRQLIRRSNFHPNLSSRFSVNKYRVALQYVRGLCWVLRYYYQGCASWKWYFPYHYAPFASDFVNVAGLSTHFEKGTIPFRPLEQLMGVFPAASSQHVPKPWAKLMSDPGVALLPFVDETRLFKALEPYYKELTQTESKPSHLEPYHIGDLRARRAHNAFVASAQRFRCERAADAANSLRARDESVCARSEIVARSLRFQLARKLLICYHFLEQRNIRGHDRFYVSTGNKSYEFVLGLYKAAGRELRALIDKEQRYPYRCEGVRGDIMLSADNVIIGGQLPSPVIGLPPALGNQVVCVRFQDPQYPEDFVFPARRLAGAVEPGRVLKPGDLSHQENRNWRPQIGMVRSNTVASLEAAGRRMLGHHLPRDRSYGEVPPPQQHREMKKIHKPRTIWASPPMFLFATLSRRECGAGAH